MPKNYIANKLKDLRTKKGLTANEVAKLIGMSGKTISAWENNRSQPNLINFFKLCKIYNVTDILSEFDTSLSLNNIDNINTITNTNNINKTLLNQEHLKKYNNLDEHGKKVIDILLDTTSNLLEIEHEHNISLIDNEDVQPKIQVKFIQLPVSAGFGTDLFDKEEDIYIEVPNTPTTSKADYALKVTGDSMETAYSDGDIVFVKQQSYVEVGQIGIFVVDGEGYLKKYNGSCLESLNLKYPDIKINQYTNVYCMGLAIGKL